MSSFTMYKEIYNVLPVGQVGHGGKVVLTGVAPALLKRFLRDNCLNLIWSEANEQMNLKVESWEVW